MLQRRPARAAGGGKMEEDEPWRLRRFRARREVGTRSTLWGGCDVTIGWLTRFACKLPGKPGWLRKEAVPATCICKQHGVKERSPRDKPPHVSSRPLVPSHARPSQLLLNAGSHRGTGRAAQVSLLSVHQGFASHIPQATLDSFLQFSKSPRLRFQTSVRFRRPHDLKLRPRRGFVPLRHQAISQIRRHPRMPRGIQIPGL
jgi:hypothetical protein